MVGGGKGILIQEDHIGTLSTLTNQYVYYSLDCYNMAISDKAQSLTCSATDSNHIPCVIKKSNRGGRYSYGVGLQSSKGFGAYNLELMPTLINGDNYGYQNGVVIVNDNDDII